ncbi:MAG TPA: NAD(P)H-dependent oxidoreductase [Geothrix sp.]|nr:NAD(P)H-dependent oxidoreductase [Geothrix sp.]
MKVLIVLAHPEPRSFNGALFDTAAATLRGAGHHVATSDLYRIAFDPVSDRRNFIAAKDPDYLKLQIEETHATETRGFVPSLEAEIAKVEAADLMIWQFPLWWFSVPGILKGWADRVFAMGRAYGRGHVYETGMFRGKRAMLSLTTGGSPEAYTADGLHGDMAAILRPIHRGILEFTGFSVLAPQIHYQPVRVDAAEREAWLEAWAGRLRGIETETPVAVGRY